MTDRQGETARLYYRELPGPREMYSLRGMRGGKEQTLGFIQKAEDSGNYSAVGFVKGEGFEMETGFGNFREADLWLRDKVKGVL